MRFSTVKVTWLPGLPFIISLASLLLSGRVSLPSMRIILSPQRRP